MERIFEIWPFESQLRCIIANLQSGCDVNPDAYIPLHTSHPSLNWSFLWVISRIKPSLCPTNQGLHPSANILLSTTKVFLEMRNHMNNVHALHSSFEGHRYTMIYPDDGTVQKHDSEAMEKSFPRSASRQRKGFLWSIGRGPYKLQKKLSHRLKPAERVMADPILYDCCCCHHLHLSLNILVQR